MSVLLRQPRGFEGFSVVPEELLVRRRDQRAPRKTGRPSGWSRRCCDPYLQAGKSLVCPGGWQIAPASCGPLLLLPGPKSGAATAGAAETARAAVASSPAAYFLVLMLIEHPPFHGDVDCRGERTQIAVIYAGLCREGFYARSGERA